MEADAALKVDRPALTKIWAENQHQQYYGLPLPLPAQPKAAQNIALSDIVAASCLTEVRSEATAIQRIQKRMTQLQGGIP
ncbi:hypothetical protein EVAR_8288_1 [Eumeta japonica]|uniref:Uncharacterized protein n=1 Tax=Eumeta variegata TaxID=151549 RepID=A0A4C1Y9Y0_EUMVA|nr:hypothetical protein EVAR_8288_1 [Eumeta japonica]